jgi:hypothetical protein
MIRLAAAAQMHADEQAERPRADGYTVVVALRPVTEEYAPLQDSLSDRNYMQENAHDSVPRNTKEDDSQDINDKNNYPTSLNAILPRMTAQQHEQLQLLLALAFVLPPGPI